MFKHRKDIFTDINFAKQILLTQLRKLFLTKEKKLFLICLITPKKLINLQIYNDREGKVILGLLGL